ncbi:MAG: capsular biosynthesis protein, partial [candidate division KSB1 bacterium]|nr:capsular biosynthesis protein [candidate division KSB1 bacterium]
MLGSRLMKVLLLLLRKKYDVVFIDSPPVLVVSDTAILGPLVDGVLLVCTSGQTNQRAVSQALALLEKGSTNILGLVLNKSLEESVPRSYKRYYQSKA